MIEIRRAHTDWVVANARCIRIAFLRYASVKPQTSFRYV